MNAKPATLDTLNRRSRRALRVTGAPTKTEIARQQAAMDAEIAREGRIAEIAAEQADEMAVARMRTAAHLANIAAEAAAAMTAAMIAAEAANQAQEAQTQTLEDVAKVASNDQIRYRVWRGAKETRVYVEQYNGSRGRPWIQKGYYLVDETTRSFRCEADRRGPVEAFEAALAAFLAK